MRYRHARRALGGFTLRAGRGSRSGFGRRRHHRRGRCRCRCERPRRGSRRQQSQWIQVALRVVRPPDPEMDVRNVDLHVARRPDRPHGLALRDSVSRSDQERAQVEQRDGEAVRRLDRHRTAVGRQPAGERDHTACGRRHLRPGSAAHVDAGVAVLAVLLAAERESAQDRAVGRPGPCARGRGCDERDREQHQQKCCLSRQHCRDERNRPIGRCQNRLQRAAVEAVTRDAGESRDDVCGGPPRQTSRDQLRDGAGRGVLVRRSANVGGADHDRDLTLRAP
jgi:hypothetical protein